MTLGNIAFAVLFGLGALTRSARAQTPELPPPSAGLRAGRASLEALLADLTAVTAAPDSSAAARARAATQAAAVRARLQDGDFQVGDRVVLRVEGADAPPEGTAPERTPPGTPRSVEQQVSDTFTVAPDRTILLPVWGTVSLRGVLRSELEPYLTREIAKYVRDPVVHAHALVRVSVIGGVLRPGFYAVPVDAVLSDALMAAGGPQPEAKVEDMRIERAGQPLLAGAALQLALAEGRTLDDVNVRAGDRFVVPPGSQHSGYEVLRTVSLLLGIPVTIYTLTRIF